MTVVRAEEVRLAQARRPSTFALKVIMAVTGVVFVASSARGYSDEERARRQAGYRPGDRPPPAAGTVTTAMGLHPDRETDPVLLDRLRMMQRRLGPEVRKRQAA